MKSSELTGIALDWAVAECEGLPLKLDPMGFRQDAPTTIQAGWWVWDGEGQTQIIGHRKTRRNDEEGYSPSTDWAQGGAIIERKGISLVCRPSDARGLWCAVLGPNRFLSPDFEGFGPTPLIAAMRCYVASKLGDEIDIPESLKTQPAGETGSGTLVYVQF